MKKINPASNIKNNNSIFNSYAKDLLQLKQSSISTIGQVKNSNNTQNKLQESKPIFTKKANPVTLIDKISK
jgi:hypothetical protein